MKIAQSLLLIMVLLLSACHPKRPRLPVAEAPAGPLVQALEQRALSFSSLKALGSIQVTRRGRRRSFENAGILLKGRERFRIEAYGPLGENLITLLWNGKEMVIDFRGKRSVLPAGSAGLERLLGTDMDPGELSAILSGNVPGITEVNRSGLFCSADGRCVLELRRQETTVHVHLDPPGDGSGPAVPLCEVYRGDRLDYRVTFGAFEEVSGYSLPMSIVVENPDKGLSMRIEYSDAEVNVPLDMRVFTEPGAEG